MYWFFVVVYMYVGIVLSVVRRQVRRRRSSAAPAPAVDLTLRRPPLSRTARLSAKRHWKNTSLQPRLVLSDRSRTVTKALNNLISSSALMRDYEVWMTTWQWRSIASRREVNGRRNLGAATARSYVRGRQLSPPHSTASLILIPVYHFKYTIITNLV